MSVDAILAGLNLSLPQALPPPGAFVAVRIHAGVATVSGQVPLKDGTLVMAGRLGDGITIEQGQDCARWARLNALAQLSVALGSLDRVEGFVRMAGFVAAEPAFTQHGAVVDGASKLLHTLFPGRGDHARIAIGCASLPRGAPVEIELTAILRDGT